MSEATETAAAPEVKKITAEIKAEVAASDSAVDKMDKATMIKELSDNHNIHLDPEKTNEQYLRRKLKIARKLEIYKAHGVTETPTQKKNREDFEKSDPSEAPKPGRKRMTTTGTFKFNLGEGGKEGRASSDKGKIISQLKDGNFKFEDFKAAVSNALEWVEAEKKFNSTTRFKDLDTATNAWWSELKNKAKIIEEVAA